MTEGTSSKLWFHMDHADTSDPDNISMVAAEFNEPDPDFFDLSQFEWVDRVEDNYQMILEELDHLLRTNGDSLNAYYQKEIVSRKNVWKTVTFFGWKDKRHKNCKACPQTTALLESIPGMVSGSISMLEPDADIHEHRGDTNAIMRCHLGLKIPGSLPECGFRAGEEERSWEEGKLFAFCDAKVHKAWNHTNERRLIMIIDVIRPEFISKTNFICTRMITYFMMSKLADKFPFLMKIVPVMFAMYFSLLIPIRILLPIQRSFAFLGWRK